MKKKRGKNKVSGSFYCAHAVINQWSVRKDVPVATIVGRFICAMFYVRVFACAYLSHF